MHTVKPLNNECTGTNNSVFFVERLSSFNCISSVGRSMCGARRVFFNYCREVKSVLVVC